MLWMVPSTFGDIRIVATSLTECKVLVEQATPQEEQALRELQTYARKKKWMPEDLSFGAVTEVKAPIEKVQKLLAKYLKPGKTLVSAVKFSDGKMEEVTTAALKYTPSSTKTSKSSEAPTSTPEKKGIIEKAKDKVAERGTTVAAPVRGCPAPDFSPARLRAREVLMAFLNPGQREDFLKYNRFDVVGATTGHRYRITSRHARDQLKDYQRTLYDLDDKMPLCVHDWDVPAEEEMHAIHILTQLPGWERFLRTLPE